MTSRVDDPEVQRPLRQPRPRKPFPASRPRDEKRLLPVEPCMWRSAVISQGRYGAPHLTDELHAQGYRFNVKTVVVRRYGRKLHGSSAR